MSKTYGDILQEECDKRFDSVFLHCDTDGLLEEVARALLLEFVKRVEEKKDEILKFPGHYSAWYDEPEEQALIQAFNQLSTELREAK